MTLQPECLITYITSIQMLTTIYTFMNFQPVCSLNDLFTHFTDIMVLNNIYCAYVSSDGSVD